MTVKEKLEQAGSKILNWIGKTKNGKSGRFVPCHEVDIDSFIKNNLNGKAITLYLYIIKELSKDYLDFAHFTISGLAEKLNTSNKTIRQSLEDCVNSGLIFTFDLGNKGKLIFLSKESNLSIIEGIEKGVFKVENYIEQKVKIDNMLVRSCTSYWEVNDLATRKQMTQQLEPNSNSYWEVNVPVVQAESIEKTTNTSTSLEPIQEPLLRTSSLEEEASNQSLKTSSENLKQPLPKNDDDFLKNFDKEEEEKVNPTIEVLEEKNDKVDPSEQKTLQTSKPDLTHNEKNSGVAGANCGQNVDKLTDKEKELYSLLKSVKNADDKILTISEKDILKIIKEVPENRIREEIERTAVRRDKKQNQAIGTPYFLSLIFKPESTIPEALKQKQIIESKETAKHTLAPIIKIFREWYKDNENLNLAKNSLFLSMKTLYEQNTSRFIDKVHYCKKQFENFNDLAKELFTGEILEVIQAI